MKKIHENTMQAPIRPSPQEAHSAPGSTNGEKVVLHPATLQLVRTLLSGKWVNGGDVLLALLEYAVLGASADVALVEIQSVQQFSAQPQWPWGYTTTCKILLVLEALGVLERRRHHHAVELRIHLGPPEGKLSQICQELDHLLQRKTPKVQRLAARVKETLLQGNLFTRNEIPSVCRATDLQPVADYLERLLGTYGVQIPLSQRQDLVQASQVIAHLLCPATHPASSEENFVRNLPLPKIPKADADGETRADQREFLASAGTPNSRGGNFQSDQAFLIPEEQFSAQTSAENVEPCAFPLLDSHRRGVENAEAVMDKKFPRMSRNSPTEEQMGNSSFRTTLNVNRNTLSEKDINENVLRAENPFEEQEGHVLATAVEGHTANVAAYRHYLTHYDPRTVLAAFIYLKQRQHGHQRRSIDSPGAYFHTILKAWSAFGPYEAACEAYQRACMQMEGGKLARKCQQLPGVPAEVQELVNDFWGWSYGQIAATLQAQLVQESSPKKHACSARGNPQAIPWLRGQDQLQEPRSLPKQWMDHDEALRLMERIGREAQTIPNLSLQLAPEPRPYWPRGASQIVYLVDVVIERIPVVYAEPAQWHTYYHNVQACLRT